LLCHAVDSTKGHCGLGPVARERGQALPLPAGEDHGGCLLKHVI